MNSFSEAVKLGEKDVRKQAEINKQIARVKQYPLNPAEWQALGKALKWEMQICGECANCDYACGENGIEDCCGDRSKNWLKKAGAYFKLRMTDGNEEQFFNELLKGK